MIRLIKKSNVKFLRFIVLIGLVSVGISASSQYQDQNWIFGNPIDGAGNIPLNFDITTLNPIFGGLTSNNTVGAPGEQLEFMGNEGTVVASDPSTGELLFYTDGERLWDGNHILKTNSLGGDASSSQPAAVCVVPVCPFDSFYVFSNPKGFPSGTGPITYRRYDKVSGNFSSSIPLPFPNGTLTNAHEGMLLIPGRNPSNLEFFLVSILVSGDYAIHKINAQGISLVDTYPGLSTGEVSNLAYTVEKSGLGSTEVEIAVASSWEVYTLTFNTLTGTLDNRVSIETINVGTIADDILYDVEYSSSGNYLYYSTYWMRVDLTQHDFFSPLNSVKHSFQGRGGGGLKRGSDGYVYHITSGITDDAGVTNNITEIGRIITPDLPMPTGSLTGFYDEGIVSMPNISVSLNFPEFVAIPFWQAEIILVTDSGFCEGDSVVLTAEFIGDGVTVSSYDWYVGTPGSGAYLGNTTTSDFVVTQNGQYYVEILLDNGCTRISNVIIVEGEQCCFAAVDPQFVQVTNSITYTSDIVWDNKYYIDDNVIVTVDGAALDITNVDVVFGECAGIKFINGGYLRANNSVFRPCSVDGSWKGLQFIGSGVFDNIVNESTFKNAEVALYFQGAADGVVSNNLFSNCNIGVRVDDDNEFDHPISGNSFVFDNFYPEFRGCYRFIDNNTTYGILTERSNLMEVSQNSFINSIPKSSPFVFGVHQTNSGGLVSENTFTNINTSVFLSRPSFVQRIEGNEIEINRNISNVNSVSVFNSFGVIVEINNNELSNNSHTATLNNAVYMERSSNVSVLSNQIRGYDIGVHSFNSSLTQTANNELTEISTIGIYYDGDWKGNPRNFITCNDITMASFDKTIGIQVDRIRSGLSVTSKCIKDAEQGIRLLGNGRIPVIRNNYVYNYRLYGLFNDNHFGDIGTSSDPGMNTFWSNNNSATDVFSNNLIQVADNFGIFNITFATVQITSNNPFHSTASCGQQIFNMPSQGNLNTDLLCDNLNSIISPLMSNNSPFELKNDAMNELSDLGSQFEKANMILSINDLSNDVQLNEILANTNMSDNEVNLLKYLHYYRTEDYQIAGQFLNLFVADGLQEENYKKLSLLDLDIIENNYQLTLTDVQELEYQVAGEESVIANYAAYILRQTSSHPSYVYAKYVETETATDLETKRIKEEDSFLSIFPNPSSDFVVIELTNAQEGNVIQLFDVSGRLVTNYAIEIFAGRVQLNIKELSEGSYFVTMTNPESGFTQKGKIMKIKK